MGDASDAYSYWSGYDDGSICDCGAPFYLVNYFYLQGTKGPSPRGFFPVKPTDRKYRVNEGASFVDESTRTMSWFHMLGSDWNERWESGGDTSSIPPGIWDSRPPTVAPESCSKYPDISSIFKFSYQKRRLDEYNTVIDKIEASHNRSCTLEDIALMSSENLLEVE